MLHKFTVSFGEPFCFWLWNVMKSTPLPGHKTHVAIRPILKFPPLWRTWYYKEIYNRVRQFWCQLCKSYFLWNLQKKTHSEWRLALLQPLGTFDFDNVSMARVLEALQSLHLPRYFAHLAFGALFLASLVAGEGCNKKIKSPLKNFLIFSSKFTKICPQNRVILDSKTFE